MTRVPSFQNKAQSKVHAEAKRRHLSDCTLMDLEEKFASALLREAGTEVSPAIDRRIQSTRRAAAADRRLPADLQAGRLTNRHTDSGFARPWRFSRIRTELSHDDREGVSGLVWPGQLAA